jgi:PAS domain S-box-containing protein
METIFESNSIISFLFNKEGKILFANPTLLKQIRFSSKDIKKHTIFDFLTPKDPKKISRAIQKLKRGKSVHNLDLKVKFGNKGPYQFEIYVETIKERLLYILRIVRDNTKTKKFERKLKELSDITKHTADSIIKTNTQFQITYMNPAAEKLYGWKLDEVLGKTPALFNAAEDVEGFQQDIYETVTSGRVFKGTYLNKRKNGTLFNCEMRISPLFDEDGEIYAFTSSQRDVTPRIQAEKQLKDALVKSDFYKDLLAHDMGNILNNLKSSIQLLEMTEPTLTQSEDRKKIMDIIKQQIKRGVSLISNVQKLSEIEGVEIPLKDIKIKPLLENAFKTIYSRFQNRNLEINSEIPQGPIEVKGGNLLLDVFENILINSCIHNDAQKIQLWVLVSKIQKKGDRFIKIEIMDNGIGINDERKDTIFERGFQKGKNRGGMGLGLSLVRKIINEYGGNIRAEDRIEGECSQGSNFILLLKDAT